MKLSNLRTELFKFFSKSDEFFPERSVLLDQLVELLVRHIFEVGYLVVNEDDVVDVGDVLRH